MLEAFLSSTWSGMLFECIINTTLSSGMAHSGFEVQWLTQHHNNTFTSVNANNLQGVKFWQVEKSICRQGRDCAAPPSYIGTRYAMPSQYTAIAFMYVLGASCMCKGNMPSCVRLSLSLSLSLCLSHVLAKGRLKAGKPVHNYECTRVLFTCSIYSYIESCTYAYIRVCVHTHVGAAMLTHVQ